MHPNIKYKGFFISHINWNEPVVTRNQIHNLVLCLAIEYHTCWATVASKCTKVAKYDHINKLFFKNALSDINHALFNTNKHKNLHSNIKQHIQYKMSSFHCKISNLKQDMLRTVTLARSQRNLRMCRKYCDKSVFIKSHVPTCGQMALLLMDYSPSAKISFLAGNMRSPKETHKKKHHF